MRDLINREFDTLEEVREAIEESMPSHATLRWDSMDENFIIKFGKKCVFVGVSCTYEDKNGLIDSFLIESIREEIYE